MEQTLEKAAMGMDKDEGLAGSSVTRPSGPKSGAPALQDMRKAWRKAKLAQVKQEVQSSPPAGDETVEDFVGTLYRTVSDGRDIKQDYTLKDRAILAVAQIQEQVNGLPGCAKYKGREEKTREGIEARLLGQCINAYRVEFGGKYKQARQLLADSSRILEKYAQLRLENHTAMVQHAEDARALNEDANTMRARLEAIKEEGKDAATTDERARLCMETGEMQKDLDETELGRNTLAGKCKHHMNMMMVYTILHASMKQQYQCADIMVNVLHERGTHINELLSGYQTGNNPAMVTKFKRELQQCYLVRERLTQLDTEYQQRTNELSAVPGLQDKDLFAVYQKTVQQESQDRDQGQQAFMKQYKETLSKVLG